MANISVPPGMAKSVSLDNRRAKIRYRCAPATMGKVLSTEDQELQFAWILDLSQQGMGMRVVRPIAPGRLIMIALKSNDGKKTFEVSASVRFCNAEPHNEWTVGCELMTRLTAEELDEIL